MPLLVPERYALGTVRDSAERVALAATSNKTGSRVRDGLLRDPDGRLVVAPGASGTWQQGLLRDADGALCVASGAGTMQNGFLRDAVGRLIVGSPGVAAPDAASPIINSRGLLVDSAGRLAITEPYDAADPRLSWAPPSTAGWVSVNATTANRSFSGDNTTSLRVNITSPIAAIGGLSISNYINVVIIGGEIDASSLGLGRTASQMVGIELNGIRGWIFIEGVLIKGAPAAPGNTAGAIGDAINLNNISTGLREERITIQNCRFENLRSDSLDQQNGTGAYVGNEVHADATQAFGSQASRGLQMDRVTIQTLYQGLFTQSGTPLGCMDLRRLNIDGRLAASYDGVTPSSGYLLYASSDNTLPRSISCQDVYVKAPVGKSRNLYISHDLTGSTIGTPGLPNRHFGDAVDGDPPGGDWCVAGVPGMTYVSPGYRWA